MLTTLSILSTTQGITFTYPSSAPTEKTDGPAPVPADPSTMASAKRLSWLEALVTLHRRRPRQVA
jgi:hypothetical protein